MTIMVSLLSLMVYGQYQEMKLIGELNNFFNFDHHIFLVEQAVDIDRFMNGTESTPKSIFVSTGSDVLKEITSKNPLLIVVAEDSEFVQNLNLLQELTKMQRLQINMKIGIFFERSASSEDLYELFEWCKDQLVINIFAATFIARASSPDSLLNIFTFSPFGEFNVINVTHSPFECFFASINSNFQQHQLKLGEQFNFYGDKPLWLIVFRKMNATFTIVNSFYPEYWEAFQDGIDIMPTIYHRIEAEDFRLYPLDVTPQFVMAPDALPYSDFSSYLRAILSNEFFGYSLSLIVVVVVFLSIFRYIKQKKIVFVRSIADILNLLINNNEYIKYQRLSRIEAFLIVPLTFVGLVIVNGILSNLKSYLTRPVFQPQIDTLEDLYWSQLPVLTWGDNEWKDELAGVFKKKTEFNDWKNRINLVDNAHLREYSQTFNRSIAFVASVNNARAFANAQKRMNIRGYHKTQIEISSLPFSYPVHEKFLFFERLNEIAHRVQSAGLYNEWIRQEYAGRKKKILQKNLKRIETLEQTGVNSFEFPMFVVYGWLSGVVLFVIEIIWKHFKWNRRICFEVKFGRPNPLTM